MSAADGSAWMAATAARYQTRVAVVRNPTGQPIQILPANPRRWHVVFYSAAGAANVPTVLPAPFPPPPAFVPQVPGPVEWKYRDAPSATTGEFWGQDTAFTGWVVVETCYVGD